MDLGDELTLEEYEKATTERVPLPGLSRRLGREVGAVVKVISQPRYFALMPLPIPESKDWPEDEWNDRMRAWRDAAPIEEVRARDSAQHEATLRVVAEAIVSPAWLTIDKLARLPDEDIIALSKRVGVLTGVMKDDAA